MVSTLSLDEKGRIYLHEINDMEIDSGPRITRGVALEIVAAKLGLYPSPENSDFDPSFILHIPSTTKT